MSRRNNRNLEGWKEATVIVLFVLIFRDLSAALLNKTLVAPLLSTIDRSNELLISLWLSGGIATLWYFASSGIKGYRISIRLQFWVIAFTIIYLLFRFPDNSSFTFISLLRDGSVLKLADIVLAFPVGIIIYHLFWERYRQANHERKLNEQKGFVRPFLTDEATLLDANNDYFKRLPSVMELRERILATSNPDHAFAISINGKWGSGKTTFINTLKKSFEGSSIILVDFNPWATKGSENIMQVYFSELAEILSEYDQALRKEILSYCNKLTEGSDSSAARILSALIKIFSGSSDIKQLRDQINDSIKKLDRKIVVYVDDVDRLDRDEIMEVLRIVRNTSSFGNVFFIVAFDKVYVSQRLGEGIEHEAMKGYLEKIFQLEYYISVVPVKNGYVRKVIDLLGEFVDAGHKEELQRLMHADPLFTTYDYVPPLKEHIRNYRDVKRFVNVFQLNYNRIKDNIYLPDYLAICLVRLKYPEIYSVLYLDKYRFLASKHGDDIFKEYDGYFQTGEIHIRYDVKNSEKKEDSPLYKDLTSSANEYALGQSEIDLAFETVRKLFENGSQIHDSSRMKRSMANGAMTITDLACFDRYFDFYLDERIDHLAFLNMLTMDEVSMTAQIEQWTSKKTTTLDLQLKLEQRHHFSNKAEFENTIRAIVIFSIRRPIEDKRFVSAFNSENLYNKFFHESEHVIQTLYNNDEVTFYAFFRNLFTTYTKPAEWLFIHRFASSLLHYHAFRYAKVAPDELVKQILADCFFNLTKDATQLTSEIFEFYINVIQEFDDKDAGLPYRVPKGAGIKMTEDIRRLSLLNPKPLLNYNIFYPEGARYGYTIGSWHIIVFETAEKFEAMLNGHSTNPAVEEFMILYNKYLEDKKPVIMELKHLTPQS